MSKRPADQDASVPKKRVKKATSIEGVSAEDFEHTDLKVLKPLLNKHVKELLKMVRADWHDGYEEQGMEIVEYMDQVRPMLQAVFNISVKSQKAFERCHEIIKIIADSWANMKTINMRGGVEEEYEKILRGGVIDHIVVQNSYYSVRCGGEDENQAFVVRGGNDMALKMWPRFLLAAASCTSSDKVSDEVLSRFIKDAADYGVQVLSAPEDEEEQEVAVKAVKVMAMAKEGEGEEDDDEEEEEEVDEAAAYRSAGLRRLSAVYRTGAWEALPSTRKKHAQKRIGDSRFDGPQHLRTGLGSYD
ncbi:hypothetical protein B484DRAFT_398428 [Ochromonadaceae sp. CCMP2298]|nr:hypothetical protein B484DRAFT_398428 [Ochromonadaceae sp. CCMP2298]